MYIVFIKILAAILIWGYVKYYISKYLLKEDPKLLEEKFNRHGPFYKMNWG